MIRVVPKSNWETPFALKRSSHSVFPGQRITFSFHLSDTAHAGRFGLQEITQTSPRAFLGLILLKGNNPADQGAIYVDYNLGQGDIAKPEILVPQKSQTWYRAEIQIQVDGSVTWRLYEGSNSPNPVIDFTENDSAFRERFRNGRFAFYLQAGTVSGNTIIDVSSYIEGTDPTNLVRSHCN